MIIKCPECGHQVSSLAETCPSCGVAIAGNIVKCPHCGGILLAGQDVCPNCLNDVHQKQATPKADNIEKAEPQEPADVVAEGESPAAPVRQPRRHHALWTTLVVALVLVLSVVFVGYYFYRHTQQQNELSAYENAMNSKEPAVLQNYLDIYVGASKEHRDSIQAHFERLRKVDQEWRNAVKSNSRQAFVKYIDKHPESVHCTEARLKIDSLDWITAATKNTVESYKAYMDQHADGERIDDAKMNYNRLSQRLVTPADEQLITQLFSNCFTSLARNDEKALVSTLSAQLTNFMGRQGCGRQDVVAYMRKLHEPDDITGMSFLVNNDWKIDKIENIETGALDFAVSFSVDQHIDRTDAEKERKAVYKVAAKVSPDGKITELNMKKQ